MRLIPTPASHSFCPAPRRAVWLALRLLGVAVALWVLLDATPAQATPLAPMCGADATSVDAPPAAPLFADGGEIDGSCSKELRELLSMGDLDDEPSAPLAVPAGEHAVLLSGALGYVSQSWLLEPSPLRGLVPVSLTMGVFRPPR